MLKRNTNTSINLAAQRDIFKYNMPYVPNNKWRAQLHGEIQSFRKMKALFIGHKIDY